MLNTSEGRRKDLQSNYYFWCDCVRCQNTSEDMEMNAAKCPNKKCKAFVDISNNNCQRCRATISTEHRSLFLEAVKFTKENLEKMGETSCKHFTNIKNLPNFCYFSYFYKYFRFRYLQSLLEKAEINRTPFEFLACKNFGCCI